MAEAGGTRKVANAKATDRARTSQTATVIDQYLAQVPEPARAALEKLRQAIRAAAPNATETTATGWRRSGTKACWSLSVRPRTTAASTL